MTLDQARQRAERNFKREERAQDGRKAMMEYEAQAVAIRKRTAHLKALRLAKEEAQAQTDEPPATQTKRRTETRRDK
ncbi:MAG: transcriptional regulator [Xanthobacteraceae bacterium]